MKFKVDDRVGAFMDEDSGELMKARYTEDQAPVYGKIAEVTEDGKVTKIEWDDEYFNDDLSQAYNIKFLMLEEEMLETVSTLEKEFALCQKEITLKLKEASSIIKSANDLAKKQGFKLTDMYNAISPLYSALNACGWRTSSFNC